MPNNYDYIKNADFRDVAKAVSQSGYVVFKNNTLTEDENIIVATNTIFNLEKTLGEMTTFFLTVEHDDPSYESVIYRMADMEQNILSVDWMERVITYKPIMGQNPRAEVTKGPLLPKAIGQAICDVLNERRNTNITSR